MVGQQKLNLLDRVFLDFVGVVYEGGSVLSVVKAIEPDGLSVGQTFISCLVTVA
jgi:hypothetical protein